MTLSIALDFDGTVTADPRLWLRFIELVKLAGHTITVVTARSHFAEDDKGENNDVLSFCRAAGIQAVFTHGEPKAKHFNAHIWIDDMPGAIPYTSEGGILIGYDPASEPRLVPV